MKNLIKKNYLTHTLYNFESMEDNKMEISKNGNTKNKSRKESEHGTVWQEIPK